MRSVPLIILYLVAIVAANLFVAHFGPWALLITAWVLIPFDLSTRDILHERWRSEDGRKWPLVWKMAVLIGSGSLLSAALSWQAAPVALASFLAFGTAGLVDTVVCQLAFNLGRFWRMNISNFFSSITDSLIFPLVAFGVFDAALSGSQAGSKFVGGIFWTTLFVVARRIYDKRKQNR